MELAFSVLVEEASMGLMLEERADRWESSCKTNKLKIETREN